MRSKSLITIVSAFLAVCFTIYIALDTFVIVRVYAPEGSASARTDSVTDSTDIKDSDNSRIDSGLSEVSGTKESESGTPSGSSSGADEPVITAESYQDEQIQITLSTYRSYETDIYVADVVISSPEYLKTALAGNAFGKNITDSTSNMAANNNAILAINGDYYGVQERGYVIRNGILYRKTAKRGSQEDLVIYQDGSMAVINEQTTTAEELIASGAWNVLCFGPGLIKDGKIAVSTTDEVARAMASNPRTAIGIVDKLHYVFVVADGRTSASQGLSLYELAQFMQELNVTTAYNLDGGGSSTLYFNGEVINNPTSGKKTSGTERMVSDIVYIGY